VIPSNVDPNEMDDDWYDSEDEDSEMWECGNCGEVNHWSDIECQYCDPYLDDDGLDYL